MKSKLQKRREARERILLALPNLDAEIALVRSALGSTKDDARLKELAAAHAKLERRRIEKLQEVSCIAWREHNPKASAPSWKRLTDEKREAFRQQLANEARRG